MSTDAQLKALEPVLHSLLQARDFRRGVLAAVRCGTPEEVDAAVETLLSTDHGLAFEIVAPGEGATSGEAALASAKSSCRSLNAVVIWRRLPKPRLTGEDPWYATLGKAVEELEKPGGARVLIVATMREIKGLVENAPKFWQRRRTLAAWPEPPRPQTAGPTPPVRPSQASPDQPGAVMMTADGATQDPDAIVAHLEERAAAAQGIERARGYLRIALVRNAQHRLDDARSNAMRAAKIFKDLTEARGLGQCYEVLGSVAERIGDIPEAQEWISQAVEAWHTLGEDVRKAECHAKLGHLAYVRGDRERAAEQFQLAIQIDEALGNLDKVAAGLRRLGLLAEEEQKWPLAEKLYRDALEIVAKKGDEPGLARCHHHLGRLYERMGDYDRALERHEEARQLKERLDDRVGLATTYHHLGNVHFFKRLWDDARYYYHKALYIESDLKDRQGLAATNQQLAEVAMNEFEWDQALAQFLLAQHLWKQLGSPIHVALNAPIKRAKDMVDKAVIAAAEAAAFDAFHAECILPEGWDLGIVPEAITFKKVES